MSKKNEIVVYGAYGYTGRLIVDLLLRSEIKPLISGRSKAKLVDMADALDLDYEELQLQDASKLLSTLESREIVIHCAGPFIHTSEQMVLACIKTKTHYMDITGEYNVFELLQKFNEEAKSAGIMLLPGAGFDVVPSDCLACQLKALMPDANSLELAFTTKGGRLSRGTAKTMVENSDKGHLVRVDGNLLKHPLGKVIKEVDYGAFSQLSVGISWGDISTAYFSTGIENITVFTGTDDKQLKSLRMAHRLRGLLGLGFVKRFIQKQIDKKPSGPSEESRKRSETYLWGQVCNGRETIERRLKVPNGYDLTAMFVVLITKKILAGNLKTGYQTPATAYGENLIFEIDNCKEL